MRSFGRPRAAGFTLLELLIAIALLGVLAVLCWRGLESVLASRDRLTREGEVLRSLTIAFAQIDDDLRRTWAVRSIPAVPRALRYVVIDDLPVLELARLGGSATDPSRIDRVVWRLNGAGLERGVAANLAGELQWQPVLAGVAQMQWRAWIAGQGWVGAAELGQASAAADAELASAMATNVTATALGLGPTRSALRNRSGWALSLLWYGPMVPVSCVFLRCETDALRCGTSLANASTPYASSYSRRRNRDGAAHRGAGHDRCRRAICAPERIGSNR